MLAILNAALAILNVTLAILNAALAILNAALAILNAAHQIPVGRSRSSNSLIVSSIPFIHPELSLGLHMPFSFILISVVVPG